MAKPPGAVPDARIDYIRIREVVEELRRLPQLPDLGAEHHVLGTQTTVVFLLLAAHARSPRLFLGQRIHFARGNRSENGYPSFSSLNRISNSTSCAGLWS